MKKMIQQKAKRSLKTVRYNVYMHSSVAVGVLSRLNSHGEKEYCLVTSRKDYGRYSHLYYFPGGHIEHGESPTDAIKREMKEELGVEVIVGHEFPVSINDMDERTYWFLCKIVEGTPALTSGIKDLIWVTKTQMSTVPIWPSTLQFIEHNL